MLLTDRHTIQVVGGFAAVRRGRPLHCKSARCVVRVLCGPAGRLFTLQGTSCAPKTSIWSVTTAHSPSAPSLSPPSTPSLPSHSCFHGVLCAVQCPTPPISCCAMCCSQMPCWISTVTSRAWPLLTRQTTATCATVCSSCLTHRWSCSCSTSYNRRTGGAKMACSRPSSSSSSTGTAAPCTNSSSSSGRCRRRHWCMSGCHQQMALLGWLQGQVGGVAD